MASEGIKDDSADSDDSMDRGRPNFTAEERTLLQKLLKTSGEFLRHNEEHQPKIQKFITQLENNTEDLLHLHRGLSKAKRKIKIAATVFAVSISVAAWCFGIVLRDLLTDDDSLELAVFTAVFGSAIGYIGYRKLMRKRDKSDGVKKAVQSIRLAAAGFTDCLNNTYNLAEKILQCHNMFYLQLHQRENLQLRTEAVSELVKLFKPGELWNVLKEKNILDLKADMEKLGPPLHLITKDRKKLKKPEMRLKQRARPSKKEKKKQSMRQEEESEAEQLDRKMRKTEKSLQKLLDELRDSKTEVENMIYLKLNEHFNQ